MDFYGNIRYSYHIFCTVEDGVCEKIIVSSVNVDEFSDFVKTILGTYKYLGILTGDNSPVYFNEDPNDLGYLFQEWDNNNKGFNGWKIVVRVMKLFRLDVIKEFFFNI